MTIKARPQLVLPAASVAGVVTYWQEALNEDRMRIADVFGLYSQLNGLIEHKPNRCSNVPQGNAAEKPWGNESHGN